MNATDDDCINSFTPGQIDSMKARTGRFRTNLGNTSGIMRDSIKADTTWWYGDVHIGQNNGTPSTLVIPPGKTVIVTDGATLHLDGNRIDVYGEL